MAFCSKCGARLDDGAAFCAACGTHQENAQPSPAAQTGTDASNNKTMAVLAYIGPLVLVPIFAAKDSQFAQFHVKQSLFNLAILYAVTLALGLLSGLIGAFVSVLGILLSAISGLAGIGCIVLAVMGIINACAGKTEELILWKSLASLRKKGAELYAKTENPEVPGSDNMTDRILCAIAYIPPLFFLPLVAGNKKSAFNRYHANQALVFNIFCVAVGIIAAILTAVFSAIFGVYLYGIFIGVSSFGRFLISLFSNVATIATTVVVAWGFFNAAFGKTNSDKFTAKIKIIK